MFHTHNKVLISAGLVFCLISSVFAYSGGSGTAEDPYQIGTVADWNDLMDTPSDWDVNFIMTVDINLQGVPLKPVGNDIDGIFFRGVFDGNGHIIRNATIQGGSIGLFGYINFDGQIRNLGVEDVNIIGGGDVAGLAGWSAGTITNCFATGKIADGDGVNHGGLVGLNAGTITGSHAACDVNGRNCIGGLVGINFGTIIDSYAAGPVNGYSEVGGLVGENRAVDINHIGTITCCYATGSVSGRDYVGGLIGRNGRWAGIGRFCPITDCYAMGAVTGNSYVGGLVGLNEIGHITNCYAAGRVTGNLSVNGLASTTYPDTVVNSFWDIETSGQTISAGGTGKTTAEMMTLSTFISAGWDFIDTWGIGENQTYPFLRTYSGADLNYDGLVDFIDFAVWANHWLEGI